MATPPTPDVKPRFWLNGISSFPVYYEDTDFSGYVYHANYLKFFERGREELVGREYVRDLYERGLHYVVARMELSFHRPGRHGDVLEVQSRMRVSHSPVVLVEQQICLANKSGEIGSVRLCSAVVKLVAVDEDGETTPVPADVVGYFESLTKGQPTLEFKV